MVYCGFYNLVYCALSGLVIISLKMSSLFCLCVFYLAYKFGFVLVSGYHTYFLCKFCCFIMLHFGILIHHVQLWNSLQLMVLSDHLIPNRQYQLLFVSKNVMFLGLNQF